MSSFISGLLAMLVLAVGAIIVLDRFESTDSMSSRLPGVHVDTDRS